ncbi:hypothetical protein [Salinibacillus xinjiangensis]|nr:hypothetical protein [Salinibacillus xinjiangensis]
MIGALTLWGWRFFVCGAVEVMGWAVSGGVGDAGVDLICAEVGEENAE